MFYLDIKDEKLKLKEDKKEVSEKIKMLKLKILTSSMDDDKEELASNLMANVREDDVQNRDVELSELAEDLINKLVEIWEG